MNSTISYGRHPPSFGGRKLSWPWIIVLALNFSVWLGVFYAFHSILTWAVRR